MDLQTERRLEKFLQLSELPTTVVQPRMEFHLPPTDLYIELQENRLIFTLSRSVESAYRDDTFSQLIRRCHPLATQGIPVRLYMINERLFLSYSPTPEQDVKHWLNAQKAMQRLLDLHEGCGR